MKNLKQIFFMLTCLCLPALLHAQEEGDSKYLAGAVPEVEGKVLFSREFSIPGMSQEEIFSRVNNWMGARLKQNENNSRVVLANGEKGQVVGIGEEWIVFSSTALSLDRTKILYQLTVTCQPEKCELELGKIRYNYREGKEKYTAEEWITDKYALNKSRTKLVRGLAKWRRKTVDFVDDLCLDMADALSEVVSSPQETAQVEEKKEEKTVGNPGPMVIVPKKQVDLEPVKAQGNNVTVTAPAQATAKPAQATATAPAKVPEAPVQVAATAPAGESVSAVATYREVAPAELPADAIQTGAGKLVIVIGEEPFNMTMMTANSGGSLGKMNGKTVVFCILSPDQPYEQMERAESYAVRFYPNGAKEPSLLLECKKLPAPAALEGMPRTYVGEIVKATVKK